MSGDKMFFRELNTLIIDDSDGMQRLLAEQLGGCVRGHITGLLDGREKASTSSNANISGLL